MKALFFLLTVFDTAKGIDIPIRSISQSFEKAILPDLQGNSVVSFADSPLF